MPRSHSLQLLFTCFALGLSGCSHRTYYAPPPPPPPQAYREAPPLIERAKHIGYRTGLDQGARDAYQGEYHPREDRAFRETPGYDPRLGPFPPYRDAFRSAYLRGYDQSFHR